MADLQSELEEREQAFVSLKMALKEAEEEKQQALARAEQAEKAVQRKDRDVEVRINRRVILLCLISCCGFCSTLCAYYESEIYVKNFILFPLRLGLSEFFISLHETHDIKMYLHVP